jgi:hypothetical protein
VLRDAARQQLLHLAAAVLAWDGQVTVEFLRGFEDARRRITERCVSYPCILAITRAARDRVFAAGSA